MRRAKYYSHQIHSLVMLLFEWVAATRSKTHPVFACPASSVDDPCCTSRYNGQCLALVADQKRERETLRSTQQARWQQEVRQRQDRYNKGLRGLVDRFTGKHREIKTQNERETLLAYQRDRCELDGLIFKHLEQRQNITARVQRLDRFQETKQESLSRDIQQYKEIRQESRKVFDFKQQMQSRQRFKGLDRER